MGVPRGVAGIASRLSDKRNELGDFYNALCLSHLPAATEKRAGALQLIATFAEVPARRVGHSRRSRC